MKFAFRPASQAAVLAALLSPIAVCSVAQAQSPEAKASGEVRRIDAEAGKITLKHGNIDVLQLPAMTLVYRIEPILLEGIQVGDKVKFTAQRLSNEYVVIKISK